MSWGEKYAPKNAEQWVKKWFSKLGEVEYNDKKGSKNTKSYDYVIHSAQILIEVKFINSTTRYYRVPNTEITSIAFGPLSDNQVYNKMRSSVKHLCKDHSDFPSYNYGGIILWDPDFATSQIPYTYNHFNETLPFDASFHDMDWQYLILREYPVVGNDRPPVYIYVKKAKLIALLKEVFTQNFIIYLYENNRYKNRD